MFVVADDLFGGARVEHNSVAPTAYVADAGTSAYVARVSTPSPKPRDWTERHDGPPSLAAAKPIVVSDRRLAIRAALPTSLFAALVVYATWGTEGVAAGAIGAALLLAVSVGRTIFWARGFGTRSLWETPTHLVLCKGAVVEQWVAWADLERVIVVHSDPAPEWSRTRTDWFHVIPQPELAVMPPAAFLSGFGDMLLSARGSDAAADRVRAVVHARGIPCHTA